MSRFGLQFHFVPQVFFTNDQRFAIDNALERRLSAPSHFFEQLGREVNGDKLIRRLLALVRRVIKRLFEPFCEAFLDLGSTRRRKNASAYRNAPPRADRQRAGKSFLRDPVCR